jgi:hypothetical protein
MIAKRAAIYARREMYLKERPRTISLIALSTKPIKKTAFCVIKEKDVLIQKI